MFCECKTLINIKELIYLNTKDIINFSGMFMGFSSLTDIKALQNGMYQMQILFQICSMDV